MTTLFITDIVEDWLDDLPGKRKWNLGEESLPDSKSRRPHHRYAVVAESDDSVATPYSRAYVAAVDASGTFVSKSDAQKLVEDLLNHVSALRKVDGIFQVDVRGYKVDAYVPEKQDRELYEGYVTITMRYTSDVV